MIESLVNQWREDATRLRQWGAVAQAEVLDRCVSDLETRAREWELAALTVQEAAAESGYSYSAIQKKLASGELENLGTKHSPRVRRGDLPRKGGSPSTGIADKILLRRSA